MNQIKSHKTFCVAVNANFTVENLIKAKSGIKINDRWIFKN